MAKVDSALVGQLEHVLVDLLTQPCPHVPNPVGGPKKRASVALILRIRPRTGLQDNEPIDPAEPPGSGHQTSEKYIDSLKGAFAKRWITEGDPEVLFIKRTGRVGDRWSGHVALPGGKRDDSDESDLAAAIRETEEEVGLDLKQAALYGGKLPERIVTTAWGNQILMVLCPFVFVLVSPGPFEVKPQPAEVASTHWVPLRSLLSPKPRTRETVDVTERMSRNRGAGTKWLLRCMLGPMTFSAIRLIPTESAHCPLPLDVIEQTSDNTLMGSIQELLLGYRPLPSQKQTLQLWGLTLGILADFLDMFPPHNAVKLWAYPTFTTPDLRLMLWLISYPLRKSNSRRALENDRRPLNHTAIDATSLAIPVDPQSGEDSKNNEVGITGLGVGRHDHTRLVETMLRGYFTRVQYAIVTWIALRGLTAAMAFIYLWRKLRKR